MQQESLRSTFDSPLCCVFPTICCKPEANTREMPKHGEDMEKHNDDQKNTDGDAVKEEEEEDDEESSSGDEENDATGYVHA